MYINMTTKLARGFTVAEVVIAMAIACVLLIAVASFTIYSGRSMAGIYNYVELDHASRLAADNMSKEARNAASLKSFSTNKLVFVDYDGLDLTYEYSPDTQTLVRQKGDETQTLLTQCDWLVFSIFKHNPTSGTYDLSVATNVAKTKVISAVWNCSRTILGAKVNTETVQEAKIVLRKN